MEIYGRIPEWGPQSFMGSLLAFLRMKDSFFLRWPCFREGRSDYRLAGKKKMDV
ncbi:hypothetical protein HMPREF3039_02164 [Akkermansia sp. KLE1798]|nr:hypothetical protein HMPREF3039_02164 [Akkermansia sp. KLE1798]KZA03882.1 hypothetical protein HMPREF1326_02422 [Akkermansia sp. KLE1605]